ncbi:MAG: hypothetical protein ACOCZK_06700 [Planctomycetota bacterium]
MMSYLLTAIESVLGMGLGFLGVAFILEYLHGGVGEDRRGRWGPILLALPVIALLILTALYLERYTALWFALTGAMGLTAIDLHLCLQTRYLRRHQRASQESAMPEAGQGDDHASDSAT